MEMWNGKWKAEAGRRGNWETTPECVSRLWTSVDPPWQAVGTWALGHLAWPTLHSCNISCTAATPYHRHSTAQQQHLRTAATCPTSPDPHIPRRQLRTRLGYWVTLKLHFIRSVSFCSQHLKLFIRSNSRTGGVTKRRRGVFDARGVAYQMFCFLLLSLLILFLVSFSLFGLLFWVFPKRNEPSRLAQKRGVSKRGL